jgi:FAD/FMN-containing dehydrogenase
VLVAWRAFTAQAPDEVESQVILCNVPPDPALPSELHGQPAAAVVGLYAGPVAAGERVLAPLREFARPLLDLSGPAPYVAVQSGFDGMVPEGQRYYWKSHYLDRLDDAALAAMLVHAAGRPTPETVLVLRHLGGAISRAADEATAYGNRAAQYNLSLDAIWREPGDDERAIAWTRAAWAALRRHATGGVYINFAGLGEEGEALVRAAAGANAACLEAVKRRYDPAGLFTSHTGDSRAPAAAPAEVVTAD